MLGQPIDGFVVRVRPEGSKVESGLIRRQGVGTRLIERKERSLQKDLVVTKAPWTVLEPV